MYVFCRMVSGWSRFFFTEIQRKMCVEWALCRKWISVSGICILSHSIVLRINTFHYRWWKLFGETKMILFLIKKWVCSTKKLSLEQTNFPQKISSPSIQWRIKNVCSLLEKLFFSSFKMRVLLYLWTPLQRLPKKLSWNVFPQKCPKNAFICSDCTDSLKQPRLYIRSKFHSWCKPNKFTYLGLHFGCSRAIFRVTF